MKKLSTMRNAYGFKPVFPPEGFVKWNEEHTQTGKKQYIKFGSRVEASGSPEEFEAERIISSIELQKEMTAKYFNQLIK